ncbi:MAG: glycosyltransferase family 2 protein [Candidatus Omnitrophica bacterium]|jgi:glycosyltransferase involved in cell wall biosynthesis|nr:glycosyltransferase family 2 protein [Candidatus Omnitrophota bacterium]
MISVIIPTYREPEALDLCLKSIFQSQDDDNEIIVVVDGFYNENKEVLDKYKVNILNLETNVGLAKATNLGVYNATNEKILIVNDDNVFPWRWDIRLNEIYNPDCIISPNQIEPRPSIFKQFIIKDFGSTPVDFNLDEFLDKELSISHSLITNEGFTLPIFMSKIDYIKLGGWDENYPGPWVVDWDFFLKAHLWGLQMKRTFNCHFYHFGSIGTTSPNKKIIESNCHEYAKYKWGKCIKNNPINNLKFL